MKRVVLAVIALMVATPAFAQTDWSPIAAKLRQSIVEVANSDGSCTGFVIDDVRDLVLTAAHCDGTDLYADSMPAKVRAKNDKADLMVLFVEGLDRPALTLAKNDPKVGAEVASYGYGFALEQPLFRVAHISAANVNVGQTHYLVVDTTFVSGQSGGPVVNAAGEVVLIVQLGNPQGVGLGVGAEIIDDKVGRFFAK